MRIAIHQVGEVGLRGGRILLGEHRLIALGVVGKRPSRATDARLEPVLDLSAYDVLVTDDIDDPLHQVRAALDAGISCVLWHDGDDEVTALGDAFAERRRTLLVGANVANGLAPCLASHEMARSTNVLEVSYAWTEPGRPLRRGEPVPFPDPVGALWGRRVEAPGATRRFVARVESEWAGAMAHVTAATADGVSSRIVGVSDLAPHLEALALTAGVVSVAEFPYGLARPADRPEDYLAAALDAGLDVAAYSMESPA